MDLNKLSASSRKISHTGKEFIAGQQYCPRRRNLRKEVESIRKFNSWKSLMIFTSTFLQLFLQPSVFKGALN